MRWCDAIAAAGILTDLARLLLARSDESAAARAERLHEKAIKLHTQRRQMLAAARAARERAAHAAGRSQPRPRR